MIILINLKLTKTLKNIKILKRNNWFGTCHQLPPIVLKSDFKELEEEIKLLIQISAFATGANL